MRSRESSLSKRALVVLACCGALATIVALVARIGTTETDRAVGPVVVTRATLPVSTAHDSERTVRVPIAARCRLEGTVVDIHGAPIDPRDGTLELLGPGDALRLSNWDPDGRFAFEGLSPGHWVVRVQSPNRTEGVARVELSAPDGSGIADLVLQRVRDVPVRIVDAEGGPLAAALAANDLQPAHAGILQIDEKGASPVLRDAHPFLDEKGGSIRLIEESSPRLRLLIGHALLDEVHPEDGVAEIVLTANIERIRAHAAWITFDLPAPIPRSTVVGLIARDREKREIRLAQGERTARIGVGPTTFTMSIAAEGYCEIEQRLRVAPGETVALGTLTLEPECILRGVVRTREGQPISGPIVVRQAKRRDNVGAISGRATADVNGRFVVRGLGQGEWLAWCEWGGTGEFVRLPRDADLELVGEFPDPSKARQGSR